MLKFSSDAFFFFFEVRNKYFDFLVELFLNV